MSTNTENNNVPVVVNTGSKERRRGDVIPISLLVTSKRQRGDGRPNRTKKIVEWARGQFMSVIDEQGEEVVIYITKEGTLRRDIEVVQQELADAGMFMDTPCEDNITDFFGTTEDVDSGEDSDGGDGDSDGDSEDGINSAAEDNDSESSEYSEPDSEASEDEYESESEGSDIEPNEPSSEEEYGEGDDEDGEGDD